MSSKEFIEAVIQQINSFRQLPTSVEKKLETFRIGLSRFKGNDMFMKEIDKFIKSIGTMKPKQKMEKNEALSESAQKELQKFLKERVYQKYQSGKTLKGKIPDEYLEQNCCLIADDGADTAADVLTKLLLNKMDKNHLGRQYLTDDKITQIGIAHGLNESDENCIICIFAYNKVEEAQEEEQELPDMDLSELKQAFDLFDVNKIEKIDPKETVAAMRSLNFDMKNPQLFKIMKELETLSGGELVDFPTFANHIVGKITDKKSEEGLRTIFNLFVDDPSEGTITILNLKRIIKDLGEKESEEEINRLLANKGGANAYLTFEEFYAYMQKTYP